MRQTQRENTLKSIFHVLEDRGFAGEGVALEELAARRRESPQEAQLRAHDLVRHGFATLDQPKQNVFFTPAGSLLARAIVRNHRLWELYLTNAAQISADHVHEDAEKIEHVLGDEVVRQLEKRLDYATRDPHGRTIPSTAEIEAERAPTRQESPVGYQGPS